MKIIYQKLRENAVLPYAATDLSGGLDITAAHIEHVSPNEVIVYTGLAMQPVLELDYMQGAIVPSVTNYRIRFSPRSSFTKHDWVLQNSPCLGDADFQGEYRLRFRAIPTKTSREYSNGFLDKHIHKLKYDKFPYKVGDRCGQLWVEEIIPIQFEEGEPINKTNRKDGFGSTGV